MGEGHHCNYLIGVVSRLGLEPRTLALKAQKDQYLQWLDLVWFSPFY